MIDVIIADHQELFRVGMAEVLAVEDDIRIVGQAQSPEQLLSVLKGVTSRVLVLSTSFLPAFPQIQPMLKRSKTALLMLAEANDEIAYMRWLRAQGIVYRSMDGPIIVEVMRRVARGELFVQKRSSDIRKDQSDIARERTESRSRIPVILCVNENSAILYSHYKILQGAGYGVLSATDGEQALSMFEAYPVDLVLLDYAMYGTGSGVVADKIKQRKPNIPVIAVSASPVTEESLTSADCIVATGEAPVLLLKKVGKLLAPLAKESDCGNLLRKQQLASRTKTERLDLR